MLHIHCSAQESGVSAYCYVTLRTSPSSGQAATNCQLRHPQFLACHSRAAFEGSEKPSQRHEKVRRKLFHVMIDTSD